MNKQNLMKQFRLNADIKLGGIARATGIAESNLSSYESGSKTPSLTTAKKIAKFFNAPVELIFPLAKRGSKKEEKLAQEKLMQKILAEIEMD